MSWTKGGRWDSRMGKCANIGQANYSVEILLTSENATVAHVVGTVELLDAYRGRRYPLIDK